MTQDRILEELSLIDLNVLWDMVKSASSSETLHKRFVNFIILEIIIKNGSECALEIPEVVREMENDVCLILEEMSSSLVDFSAVSLKGFTVMSAGFCLNGQSSGVEKAIVLFNMITQETGHYRLIKDQDRFYIQKILKNIFLFAVEMSNVELFEGQEDGFEVEIKVRIKHLISGIPTPTLLPPND